MKKLFLLVALVASLASFSQGIKITDMPTHSGSLTGAYVPIVIPGSPLPLNRKYDAGNWVLANGSYTNPSWIVSLPWSKITSKPTTLSGYGITDPIVLTTSSYSNPSWITALAHSKITYTGTTAQYVRGDGSFATFPTLTGVYVPYTGATGNVDIGSNWLTGKVVRLNAAAGNSRELQYTSSTNLRWNVYATSEAETGSNAGSNLSIDRYADAGTVIGYTMKLWRSNGLVDVANTMQAGKFLMTGNFSSANSVFTTNTVGAGFRITAATYTNTDGNTSYNHGYSHTIGRPTLASASALTYTNAATLYVDGSPIAGTNTTISSAYAAYFNGNVFINNNLQTRIIEDAAANGLLLRTNIGSATLATGSIAFGHSSAYNGGPGATERNLVQISNQVSWGSGTAGTNFLKIVPVSNFSGSTYTGPLRGIYVDFQETGGGVGSEVRRAFENVDGHVLLNSTADNTIIGSTSNTGEKLQVNGTSKFTGASTFNSSLNIKSLYVNYRAVPESSYSVDANQYFLELNSTNITKTLTLPSAASNTGRLLVITNLDGVANWSFSTAVKDAADANITLIPTNSTLTIISNGANWRIVSVSN